MATRSDHGNRRYRSVQVIYVIVILLCVFAVWIVSGRGSVNGEVTDSIVRDAKVTPVSDVQGQLVPADKPRDWAPVVSTVLLTALGLVILAGIVRTVRSANGGAKSDQQDDESDIVGNNDGVHGRNETYRIGRRLRVPRAQAVREVQTGKYPGAHTYTMNGQNYIREKANRTKRDNINRNRK